MQLTKTPPLVIDLDGTLLRSNLLIETALVFLRSQPHRFPALLIWLFQGKASLKHRLATETHFDVSHLPYDSRVIELIQTERARGRRIVLATASHRDLAERIARHLKLFDQVIATDRNLNMSARNKRAALVDCYGERNFDYAGNSKDDLSVWSVARYAYVVNAPAAVERRAQRIGNVAQILRPERRSFRDWRQALRVHQWLKNLLVFAPILAAHRYTEPSLLIASIQVFFLFSLCASSVYMLNDLLDLNNDRQHLLKRLRPFAAGRLPIESGVVVASSLLAVTFGLGFWLLSLETVAGLFAYWTLTFSYSMVLKRILILDVLVLAVLYTFRIVVGAIETKITLSFWLLALSICIFLSLALLKRYSELSNAQARGQADNLPGRNYSVADLGTVSRLGAAAGYIAVLVLALYINDEQSARLYRHPQLLWLACPLLVIWIRRAWLLAHRGQMNEDPIIFATHDRTSLVIGALLMLIFWAAI